MIATHKTLCVEGAHYECSRRRRQGYGGRDARSVPAWREARADCLSSPRSCIGQAIEITSFLKCRESLVLGCKEQAYGILRSLSKWSLQRVVTPLEGDVRGSPVLYDFGFKG